MTAQKIEGTFFLDGLLEGPIFSPEDEPVIQRLVDQARSAGLKFHLALDSGRFSVLADKQIAKLPYPQASADSIVKEMLEELVRNYSRQECSQLMSTLRSVEYLPMQEKQTLYAIVPDGTISVQQRTIQADTVAPAPPLDMRTRLKYLGIIAGIMIVLFAISTLFVPYRSLYRKVVHNLKPFQVQNVQTDATVYQNYFQIEVLEIEKGKDQDIIRIRCKIKPDFPDTKEKLNQAWNTAHDSLEDRLALEALARKNVRCELYGPENKYLKEYLCRIHWDKEDKILFCLYIPLDRKIERMLITY